MVSIAKVMLWDMPMGILKWNEKRNIAEFQYDTAFAGTGIEPSPIIMPAKEGHVYSFASLGYDTYKGLPGLIAESLPDTYGQAIFDKWLTLIGRKTSNSIESLCFLGKRCMGAMEFEPAMEIGDNPNARFEIDSLVDVARLALDTKKSFSTNLASDKQKAIIEILQLGTSAGGQRAKALIAYNSNTGEIRSGQIEAPKDFDYYLIKLDGVSGKAGFKATENYGRLEYSYYKMAISCGIKMTECKLIEENGRAHFMTKRFDRQNGQKIHMQTLCGLAHYDYRMLHGYSYEQAFQVMRELRLTYAEAEEMFRRIVFNVVARNQDDHTKNISFLMDKNGKWSLSPAYDMCYAFNPNGDWTATHQMSVNGKYDDISRQDLLELATRENIKKPNEIIDYTIDTIAKWNSFAEESGVPKEIAQEIYKNLKLEL